MASQWSESQYKLSYASNGLPTLDEGKGQAWLQAMMGRKYRITTEDGRQFKGELQCTDNQKNLVLAQTQEWRPPYKDEIVSQEKLNEFGLVKNRYLGLTVIPGKFIKRIEVLTKPEMPLYNAGQPRAR